MKVLVTGATGFAGGHLAKALSRNHEVRVLVRSPENLQDDVRVSVEVMRGSVTDANAVDQAVAGCEQIYHLAAAYRESGARKHVYRDVHVTGTKHLLKAGVKHGISRFVHCSTMGVHGHVTQIPSDESSPFNPGDEYQRTKLEGEQLVWSFCREHDLPFSVVRPAGIYGPGDFRLLKLFRSVQNGSFPMLGTGKVNYHLVYIDDLVKGFMLCGSHENALNQAFFFGHRDFISLNDMTALIAKLLNVKPPKWRFPVWPVYAAAVVCEAACYPFKLNPPLFRRRVDFYTHNRSFTIAKAQKLLGYEPSLSLEQGFRNTIAWYRQEGLLA